MSLATREFESFPWKENTQYYGQDQALISCVLTEHTFVKMESQNRNTGCFFLTVPPNFQYQNLLNFDDTYNAKGTAETNGLICPPYQQQHPCHHLLSTSTSRMDVVS